MMVSDDCLVECPINDSDEQDDRGEEQINTPPPPPEFASKASTPSSKTPTPPTTPTTTTPDPHPISRDPYGINQHLKVKATDVLPEPATYSNSDTVTTNYKLVGFEITRVWTYRILSLLFAVPLSFLCGVFLALLACLHVWFMVPCVQLSNTFLPCLRSLCMCTVNSFIAPFCTSLALFCSQIAISLSSMDKHQATDKQAV